MKRRLWLGRIADLEKQVKDLMRERDYYQTKAERAEQENPVDRKEFGRLQALVQPWRHRIPRWALDQAVAVVQAGASCRSSYDARPERMSSDVIEFAERIAWASGEVGAEASNGGST